MTYEVWVTDKRKNKIANAIVRFDILDEGKSYPRSTDGEGYSNVSFVPPSELTLLTVTANGYKTYSEYLTTVADDQVKFIELESFNHPSREFPRFWKGNMCGTRVPGLPSVPGGYPDTSLVLSWFYDRYSDGNRFAIREAWRSRGLTHVLTSWPDSRAYGHSELDYAMNQLELLDNGFNPCPFLTSKDHDAWLVGAHYEYNLDDIIAGLIPVMTNLKAMGIGAVCIGWELSLWIQPKDLQILIDFVSQFMGPLVKLYVHFQEGYGSFQLPDTQTQRYFFKDFWNGNVGKLTGLLHQKVRKHNRNQYRYDSGGITDILVRFAGGFGCTSDSGFGHPFDFVACEITALDQSEGGMPEEVGNEWGRFAIDTPPVVGSNGTIAMVMGSCNGL